MTDPMSKPTLGIHLGVLHFNGGALSWADASGKGYVVPEELKEGGTYQIEPERSTLVLISGPDREHSKEGETLPGGNDGV